MTTIGDVFSIVAAILGGFLTLWAAVLGAGLLFPMHSMRARAAVEDARMNFGRGLLVLLTLGLVSVVLVNVPAVPMRGVGVMLMLWLFSISILGTSGLARLVASRVQDQDPMMSSYNANLRGTAIVVGGTLLPLVSWFGFAPVIFVVSLGAGWKAVVPALPRRSRAEVA